MTAFIAGFAVYWALCGLVAYIAGQRGRNAVGLFFLSLLASPLIGFLVTIGLPVRERVAASGPATSDDGGWLESLRDPVFAFCYLAIAFCVGGLGWIAIWGPR